MVLHYTLNGTDDHTMTVPDALGVSLVKSYADGHAYYYGRAERDTEHAGRCGWAVELRGNGRHAVTRTRTPLVRVIRVLNRPNF